MSNVSDKERDKSKSPEEVQADTTKHIADTLFGSDDPFTKGRKIDAQLERERLKRREDNRLQLVNMSGGHLAVLIFGVWLLLVITAAFAAATIYTIMGRGIESPTIAVKAPPVTVKMEAPVAPAKTVQLFVIMPEGEKGVKTVKVERINPVTWPKEVRVRLSGAVEEALKRLRNDPPVVMSAPAEASENKKSRIEVKASESKNPEIKVEDVKREKLDINENGVLLPPPRGVKSR